MIISPPNEALEKLEIDWNSIRKIRVIRGSSALNSEANIGVRFSRRAATGRRIFPWNLEIECWILDIETGFPWTGPAFADLAKSRNNFRSSAPPPMMGSHGNIGGQGTLRLSEKYHNSTMGR